MDVDQWNTFRTALLGDHLSIPRAPILVPSQSKERDDAPNKGDEDE